MVVPGRAETDPFEPWLRECGVFSPQVHPGATWTCMRPGEWTINELTPSTVRKTLYFTRSSWRVTSLDLTSFHARAMACDGSDDFGGAFASRVREIDDGDAGVALADPVVARPAESDDGDVADEGAALVAEADVFLASRRHHARPPGPPAAPTVADVALAAPPGDDVEVESAVASAADAQRRLHAVSLATRAGPAAAFDTTALLTPRRKAQLGTIPSADAIAEGTVAMHAAALRARMLAELGLSDDEGDAVDVAVHDPSAAEGKGT